MNELVVEVMQRMYWDGPDAGLHSGVTVPVRTLPDSFYIMAVHDEGEEDKELELRGNEYTPNGPRVPLDAFCQPVLLIDLPRNRNCTICGTDVITVDVGDETVITACQHYFHAECLRPWVNDSAVSSANTCPDCRKEMCEARSRIPVDIYDELGDEDDDGHEEDEDELRRYLVQLRGEPTSEKPRRSNQHVLEPFDIKKIFCRSARVESDHGFLLCDAQLDSVLQWCVE